LNQVRVCNTQKVASLYQVRGASSIQMKPAFAKKHNPCIYKNCVSFLKSKISLYFCNQFYSTLAKADDNPPDSTVHE